MINFIQYTAITLGSLWILWVFFLAIMCLKSVRDAGGLKRGDDAYYIGMSVLFVGFIIDFTVNVLLSPIFLEPPFETTVTARVTRWKKEPGYRGDFARWMCAKVLDPFQQGGHCN